MCPRRIRRTSLNTAAFKMLRLAAGRRSRRACRRSSRPQPCRPRPSRRPTRLPRTDWRCASITALCATSPGCNSARSATPWPSSRSCAAAATTSPCRPVTAPTPARPPFSACPPARRVCARRYRLPFGRRRRAETPPQIDATLNHKTTCIPPWYACPVLSCVAQTFSLADFLCALVLPQGPSPLLPLILILILPPSSHLPSLRALARAYRRVPRLSGGAHARGVLF